MRRYKIFPKRTLTQFFKCWELISGRSRQSHFFARFAAVKKAGKITSFRKFGAAKSLGVILLIICSQFQSIALHAHPAKASKPKSDTKEFTIIKSGLLPSSTRVEVINQELPWMEEIHFKTESDEKPRTDLSFILKKFFIDLFRVIAPTNAP